MNLEDVLEQYSISQFELARRCGVTRTTIYHIIKRLREGKPKPVELLTALHIQQALKLLTGETFNLEKLFGYDIHDFKKV